MASTENLIRWAGIANLLAGVSLIIHVILHPVGADAAASQSGLWLPAHTIGFFGFILGMFGLLGLFARQSGAFKGGGVGAFLLAFAGQTMTAGVVFFDSFLVPVLGKEAPSLLSTNGPIFTGAAGLVIIAAGILVTIGYIAFGAATIRAGLLPKGGAALLIAGSWFGIGPVISHYAFVIGGIVFGAGTAWLGYGLWARPK